MTPLPPGFRLRLDPSVRAYDDGRVLAGGAPARVMRLSDAGRSALAALRDGAASEAARTLGRRLVDAGMAHPLPPVAAAIDVTVVVPVHERVEELDRCLGGVGGAPVVVVDDGSARAHEIARVCERHGATLVRRPTRGGPAAARNAALPAIQTELVAFLDSDTVPAPGWLATLGAHFADARVGAVAPRIAPLAPGDTAFARYAESRSALDMGPDPSEVAPGGRVPYVPTAALVVRAAALPAFDTRLRFGEDVDLVWRMRDSGWRVRYEPAARVVHAEPASWRPLLHRRLRYGTAAAALSRRHPGRLAPAALRPWPTTAAALLLTRRPAAALVATVVPAARLARRMRRHGVPPARSIAWSSAAVAHTLAGLSRASIVIAAPVLVAALASRRTRLAAIALLVAGPLEEWARRRPPLDPVRWTLAVVVDDAAYGVGVWRGCIRERTAAPLTPAIRIRSRAARVR